MTEPFDLAAIRAACPHTVTYESIQSTTQLLQARCDDCGKNLTKPGIGTVWDELARLRARIAELEADATRKRPLMMCNGGEMVLVTDMKAYLARPTTLPAGWTGPVTPISDTTGDQQ